MIPDAADTTLLQLTGELRRARGFRLYTRDGRRLLDLCQDGGRSILGHGSGRMITVVKNALERGPNAGYPSVHGAHLERAVRTLIPGDHGVRVFGSALRAVQVLSEWLGQPVNPADIADPVHSAGHKSSSTPMGRTVVGLWRPFLPFDIPVATAEQEKRAILPILPGLGDSPPQVVLFSPAAGAPDSDLVAPYRLAGVTRGVYDLIAAPRRPGAHLPGFQSVGPYLLPDCAGSRYATRFRVFLEHGVVISPDARVPTIWPEDLSDGERAALGRAAAFDVQSGVGNGN